MQLMEIEDAIGKIDDVFSQEVVSKAREEYNALYREELQLNSTFNHFVVNYKAAYEGKNTKREQIAHSTLSLQIIEDQERKFLIILGMLESWKRWHNKLGHVQLERWLVSYSTYLNEAECMYVCN